VEAEAPEKFLSAEGHDADLTPVAVVLPPKRHLGVGHVDEPMIGDRDAMGVPGQIVEHVARTAERRLRVHDPVVMEERAEPGPEGRLVGEMPEVRRQREGARAKRPDQARDDLSAKHATQDLHGEKEGRGRMHPARPVGRETAGGHDAVHVRVVQEGLPPGVEDAQKDERRAKVLACARHLKERRGTAWKSRSYSTRWFCSASPARACGRVNTTWAYATGSSSRSRAASH